MATVIAIRENGTAEVFVPKQTDTISQTAAIKQEFPECTVQSESPRFLTVSFKSVRFASAAKRRLS